MNTIKARVNSFSLKTSEEKELHFSLEKLSRPYGGKSAAQEIYDWLDKKAKDARDITGLVSDQCAKLQCDQSKI